MAAATATIRVTRETRDLLARQARERGVSVSALLSEMARDAARERAFRSEREATRSDSESSDVRAEERDWGAAVGDGID